ncbi:MAG: hypothetical protein ACRCZO_15875 [Cetobacterium sp.]|uniref:hypothetical protein n=1 Tax=Cetobacterium sp. TaxID=2071632 RepID=UPI003F2C06DD
MTNKDLISIILIVYIIITRSMMFGYFLKDKKEYKFSWEDYFEYFINFFFIELVLLVPRVLYPFILAIIWIVDIFQEEK